MRPRVYIETSVISYLGAKPSRDLITAAHQQITQDWWGMRRGGFDIFVSEIVVQEARQGNTEAAARRLEILQDIPSLATTSEVEAFAAELAGELALPDSARADAIHIALAVVNGLDYLLTWNCKHIANASLRHKIESLCLQRGYEPPVICTPEELLEE